MLPDTETCYRAVQSRDPRFDGCFFTAVRTTGIYCRPSCPAITPRQRNVTFYPSAAAAQGAGFRACKRCHPDASPGSPEWDHRGDLAGRALRLIGDGVIDRDGVPGLARRLGYSQRQVARTLVAEVGATPIALARAQRAQSARVLLESTALPATDVAFAAGFASVRQFNETIQAVFATTPTDLRAAAGARTARTPRTTPAPDGPTPGELTLRLPYRTPMDLAHTLDFLAARAVPGVEQVTADAAGQCYRRTLRPPGGPTLITVRAAGGTGRTALSCTVRLTDLRDLSAVVARVRRLFDLDADPVAVDAVLGADPALGALVAARPGIRSPGAVDGFELAVRAIVGQQVSVVGARTVLGRIVAAHGPVLFTDPASAADQSADPSTAEAIAWRGFPSAAELAAVDPGALPLPRARARSVVALADAVADGRLTLDPGADRDRERAALLDLPGVGVWTADYIRMRALADPNVLLDTDLVIRRARDRLSLGDVPTECWAPWRSYATHHLWLAGP